MDYKKEIIQMIEKIEDAGTLGYLHTFIKLFFGKVGLVLTFFFSR